MTNFLGQIWVIVTGEHVKELCQIQQWLQTFHKYMHYADLSSYEYYREIEGSERADYSKYLNVGWLDSRLAFPTGETPAGFLEKLFSLCLKPVAETRGFHVCDLCQNPKHFEMLKAERNGVICRLGNGEIRVRSSEFVYVAPTLIYHYVSEHSYLPPGGFIEAVLLL